MLRQNLRFLHSVGSTVNDAPVLAVGLNRPWPETRVEFRACKATIASLFRNYQSREPFICVVKAVVCVSERPHLNGS